MTGNVKSQSRLIKSIFGFVPTAERIHVPLLGSVLCVLNVDTWKLCKCIEAISTACMLSQLELYLSRHDSTRLDSTRWNYRTGCRCRCCCCWWCWCCCQCNGWHFMTTRNNKAHVIGWLVRFFEYLCSALLRFTVSVRLKLHCFKLNLLLYQHE